MFTHLRKIALLSIATSVLTFAVGGAAQAKHGHHSQGHHGEHCNNGYGQNYGYMPPGYYQRQEAYSHQNRRGRHCRSGYGYRTSWANRLRRALYY